MVQLHSCPHKRFIAQWTERRPPEPEVQVQVLMSRQHVEIGVMVSTTACDAVNKGSIPLSQPCRLSGRWNNGCFPKKAISICPDRLTESSVHGVQQVLKTWALVKRRFDSCTLRKINHPEHQTVRMTNREIIQLAEAGLWEPGVAGSNPAFPTKRTCDRCSISAPLKTVRKWCSAIRVHITVHSSTGQSTGLRSRGFQVRLLMNRQNEYT